MLHAAARLLPLGLAIGLAACSPASNATDTSASTATGVGTAAAMGPVRDGTPLRSAPPAAFPVLLDNPSGSALCHYGPTVGSAEGVAVHAAPAHGAPVTAHLPQDWTVFLCTVSADGQWEGIVHDYGLDQAQHCAADDPDCSLTRNCALTAGPQAQGQSYTGPCHSGWIPVGHTFALTD